MTWRSDEKGVPVRLEVVTPGAIVVDVDVDQVTAESSGGSFTLLPRHVDLVSSLVPGLIAYVSDGIEHLVAIDGGVLVKCGSQVKVAAREAARGDSVLELQRALRGSFAGVTESERRSRGALTRLETDAVRRLIELEDHG